jgi:hypothetical protein
MCEFFPFRYYPMIADGFLDILGASPGVRPLAGMTSLWLAGFKVISIFGAIWSMLLVWQISGRLSGALSDRVKISAPFWILISLILSGFIAHIIAMVFLNLPGITGPRG